MAIHDEDDDTREGYEASDSWDAVPDEGREADEHDWTPEDDNQVPCTECGAMIFHDTAVCPHCGYAQLEKRRSTLWYVGMVALALVLVFFLVISFWSIRSDRIP
jgi:ribosomal protein L37E